MPSQIRPNRPEVSDRFPMLGFTIKTDGGDKRYEVALASDFSLFRPDARAQRTRGNFYSSRCCGLQPITAGESVYVLPPEVLARFVGQEKLYYALVTYSGSNGGPPEISAVPSAGSAYISLKGLTGRSLKRVRILPNRQRANANYGNGSGTDLEWGGDVATPGSQAVTAPAAPANGQNGHGAATAPAPEVNYSDGFGPMPPPAAIEPAPPQAAALGNEIPLDPGIGGMSIGPDALEIGDIIISTTNAAISRIIRAGTGSQISHAMLYVGQGGQVIESVGSGVRMLPLADAIADATVAVAVRKPDLSPEQRQIICDVAARYIGHQYNYLGIVRQANFQIHSRVCSLLPESAQAACRQFIGNIDLGTNNSSEFYCSELVFTAYAQAGVPLTTTPPNWSTADDLAQAFLSHGALAYVGHLKAPPLARSRSIFEVFGLGLSAGNGNGRAAVGRMPAYARPLTLTVPRIPVEQASRIQVPPAREATTLERIAIEAAVVALTGPLAPTITALRALASTQNISIGIGPAAAVGFGLGLGAGVGVIFAPGGRVGVYGQLDVRAGIIDSASVGAQVTIMRGGIESWNEVVFAVGGAFVEGIELTVQVLFNAEHGFRGVSFEVGVGLSVEPFEVFIAVEGTASQQVAGAPAAAHGLSAAYRPYQIPVRAQSGEECFSINWDDVQLIAQPTGRSCWATAGAMVLGWYNQQSISVETVAQIAGRTTRLGIYPNEHCPFGTDIGLVCEAPMCYTVEGFRNLLENYGPLWVGVLAPFPSGPGGHAVVVTGMYSDGAPDGSDTYIRVADPWDRIVGSPGSPGAYLNTYATGSRYIMSWADFMREYEDRATSQRDGTVNVQILHAESSSGRQPSRSGAVGYAQAIALDASSFSINWDDVLPLAQPTDITGWAAAAAMVVDWANQTSTANAVHQVITRSGIDASVAITPSQHSQLASSLNLLTENPAPLTFDQLQSLLDTFGPLWFSLQIGGPDGHAHSLVVTGMFSDGAPDGSDTFVRITDPWPRVVGTVGSPGAYAKTGGTPSQYIMKFNDFKKQFDDRLNAAPGSVLIMHAAGTGGRQPRRQTGPGAGYAQSYSGNGSRTNLPPPPKPVIRSQAMNVAVGIASTIAGAVMERVINHDGSITWELEQLRGIKHPNDVAPSPAPPFHDAATIRLDDWPYVEAIIGDRLAAWFSVDWQYNGRSLGNVQITNIGTNGALLRGMRVSAHIMDDNIVYPAGNPTHAALRIRINYTFNRAIGSDCIAITELHLFGDGTFTKTCRWEQY